MLLLSFFSVYSIRLTNGYVLVARYVVYRVRNFKRRCIYQKGLQVKFGTYRSPEKEFVAAVIKKKYVVLVE